MKPGRFVKPVDTGNAQYSAESIDHYEAIYGRDFVSPGGLTMARELVSRMHLEPHARVLDVGCGLGGAAFLMARDLDLRVDGIDLSANMIGRAQGRLDELGLGSKIQLTRGDCLELAVEDRYDAIHSRDVFLHIREKGRLFSVLRRAMKPGGTLLFTDYCCGSPPWRPDFAAYVSGRQYTLHTVTEYRDILEVAGLKVIEAVDWTERFLDCLRDEAERIETAGFDADTVNHLVLSWRDKIDRANTGDHRWGLFIATC